MDKKEGHPQAPLARCKAAVYPAVVASHMSMLPKPGLEEQAVAGSGLGRWLDV